MDLESAPGFPAFISALFPSLSLGCEALHAVFVVQCLQETDGGGGLSNKNHEKMRALGWSHCSQQVFYHAGSGRFMWNRE